jgi:hypothetical protein
MRTLTAASATADTRNDRGGNLGRSGCYDTGLSGVDMGLFKKSVEKMYEQQDIAGLIRVLQNPHSSEQRLFEAELALIAIGPSAVASLLDMFDNADDDYWFREHNRCGIILLEMAKQSDEAMVCVFAAFGEYVEGRCPTPAAFKAALGYVWGKANEGPAKLTPPPRLQELARSRFGVSDFEFDLIVRGSEVAWSNEWDRKLRRP